MRNSNRMGYMSFVFSKSRPRIKAFWLEYTNLHYPSVASDLNEAYLANPFVHHTVSHYGHRKML